MTAPDERLLGPMDWQHQMAVVVDEIESNAGLDACDKLELHEMARVKHEAARIEERDRWEALLRRCDTTVGALSARLIEAEGAYGLHAEMVSGLRDDILRELSP